MTVAESLILRDRLTGMLHRGHMLPGGFYETQEGWSDHVVRLEGMPPDPKSEELCHECFFKPEEPTLNTRSSAP